MNYIRINYVNQNIVCQAISLIQAEPPQPSKGSKHMDTNPVTETSGWPVPKRTMEDLLTVEPVGP